MFNPNQGFDMSQAMQNAGGQPQWGRPPVPAQPMPRHDDMPDIEAEEGDQSRRPPNAFILYSQSMRSQVRQENPSLSNTECSRLLGKMWKEVPNEIKLQYKQKAAAMQEEFKRTHPDYTYRKARRKRALNELLTKSSGGVAPGGFPGPVPNNFQDGAWPGMQNLYMPGMPGAAGAQGMNNMPNLQGMNNSSLPSGMPGAQTPGAFPGAPSSQPPFQGAGAASQPHPMGGAPPTAPQPGQASQPGAQPGAQQMFPMGGLGGFPPQMFQMGGFGGMPQGK